MEPLPILNQEQNTNLDLSYNALIVLKKRFLRRGSSGEVMETPEQMFRRTAKIIAAEDEKFGKSPEEISEFENNLYEVLSQVDFESARAMVNTGRPYPQQQLSACYVLPIEDTMDSIFSTLRMNAFLQKWDAGAGFDFSKLRPKGDILVSTGGHTSGPVSFMKVYDEVAKVVSSAATRRVAMMAILRVDHPDILEFITMKEKAGVLEHFNISVAVTDEFMKAVKGDKDYPLINPRTGQEGKRLKAREVFEQICKSAHKSAEPGLIFIDEINRENPTAHIGKITATNPCGEQPLHPFESCNLAQINLKHFVKEGDVDWNCLRKMVELGVHFLDNTIEANHYLFPEIEHAVKGNRRIGLGIMGFADMLIQLDLPYNSEKALEFAEKLMGFITNEARQVSVRLGKERGNFPNFKGSKWDLAGFKYMRNATVTTIAPTGNASIIGNCSAGIEPVFALVYLRQNLLGGEELLEVHPIFGEIAKKRGFYTESLMGKISETGSCQSLDEFPEDVKRVFVVAHDIKPEFQVRMQAAFQKFTDNGVSKTVNMPYEAAVDDVRKVYELAHELRCKGITVYRDRSRDKQVLNVGKK